MNAPSDPVAALRRLRGDPTLAQLRGAIGDRAGIYLVGGMLRDELLGRTKTTGKPLDIDLAVGSGAAALSRKLARGFSATAFTLHEATQVFRVAVPARRGKAAMQIDIAQIQGRDILEDLARRDFTANAIALPLAPGAQDGWIDPHEGIAAIRRRILSPVSAGGLKDDPVRVLRAFRLAATLDLDLSAAALAAARGARGLLRTVAGERLRVELLGLLATPSAQALETMDAAGILTAVFPELEPSRRCAIAYYGKGGVLRHALNAVARFDFLLEALPKIYPKFTEPIRAHLASSLGGNDAHAALLRLAVLLHDVAKPATARRIGGRLRFFGHEAKGAEMSEVILRRLRFSKDEIAMVSAAVRHHLRPGNLAASGTITDKAAFRFFRDLGPHSVDLLLLCWADHSSYLKPVALGRILGRVGAEPRPGSRGPRSAEARKTLFHLQVVSLLIARNFERPDLVRPKRWLDGREIMKTLGLAPGPRIGEILAALEEAQVEGKLADKVSAIRFIRTL